MVTTDDGAILIDGAAIARVIQAEVAARTAALRDRGVIPGLSVILVGDDPASAVYVRAKERTSQQLGMKGETILLPASTTQDELLAHIDRLNADGSVHGILVQMPLPAQIDSDAVIRRVRPDKDVDGFHPVNVGKLLIGQTDGFVSCTPAGVMEMLRRSGVQTRGRNAVVVGRSNIVGKPMVALLMQPGTDATVTVCHSRTRDLAEETRRADILIAAIGRAEMITADMIKPGAVVIDVGMNRVDDPSSARGYRLCGDVAFEEVRRVASMITPVPGGVGKMTIAMLLANTVRAAEQGGRPVTTRRGKGSPDADAEMLTLFDAESAGGKRGSAPPRGTKGSAKPPDPLFALPPIPIPAPRGEPFPGETPSSAVSVATLTNTARDVIEGAFTPLWVRGEVTDFKAHRNGHWYFSLRDARAQIRCVVWSRDARRLPAAPDDGMQVRALGQLTVFAGRGDMQLQILSIDAAGDGLWRKALERTRLALERDGLLDTARKRALPRFPRVVAVITSQDGAALHDIVSVTRRRSPATRVVLVPAAVQGESAPDALCAALERVRRWGRADVLIIGRGGGAREDLWAFNDERVARALAACPVPTVSAVGHETDITICDLVADVRAATPSAAAEVVVPPLSRTVTQLVSLGGALSRLAGAQIAGARDRAHVVAGALARRCARAVESRRGRLDAVAGRLHVLSPLATLRRGYAVVRRETGEAVTNAGDLGPGDHVHLVMRDGTADAVIERATASPAGGSTSSTISPG